ncbi:MAG: septal ring lytic transglycosylase RlpA family protein [Hyphomonadaceae bacterium]
MLRLTPRVLLLAGFSACALSGAALAQQQGAPITYAGQGATPAATQTAAVGALTGGDERSYGYGSTGARERGEVVIDIRRPTQGGEHRSAPPPQAPATQVTQLEADVDAAATPQTPPDWLERERVGPPYEANGQWYVPTPEPGYAETGVASWYGPTFHGQRTASGEVFDQEALTAAHPTLPIPSLVQVTNLENGREVIVRVNDRGPFVGGRLIDLSRRSAEVLGFEGQGQARVHVRYLGPAPRRVNADGSVAPATPPVPPVAPAASAQVEEGPAPLLPPSAQSDDDGDDMLAGAPTGDGAARPPAAYAPPATGAYVVQVGAFSDPSNAQRVRNEVQTAGPVTVDVRRAADGRELFRVRVGPFQTQAEADDARRTLASLGYGEAVIAAR